MSSIAKDVVVFFVVVQADGATVEDKSSTGLMSSVLTFGFIPKSGSSARVESGGQWWLSPSSVPFTVMLLEPSTSSSCPQLLSIRLMELTLGRLSLVQMPSTSNLSLISQANMDEFVFLYMAMLVTTDGVDTLGLLPPIAPGRMDPVSA